MANNAEAIGRLIASDTLFKGERQLLRKQDQPSQQLDGEAAQPTAPPISHNDKAMASVLLTLLDEQLDASIADMASSSGAASDGNEAAPSSNRIAARYVENDSVVRDDFPNQGTAIPLGQSSQQIVQAAASPELQTYIQRFLMSAAARVQTDGAQAFPGGRLGQNRGSIPDSVTMKRIVGAALVLVLVLVAIVARFGG